MEQMPSKSQMQKDIALKMAKQFTAAVKKTYQFRKFQEDVKKYGEDILSRDKNGNLPDGALTESPQKPKPVDVDMRYSFKEIACTLNLPGCEIKGSVKTRLNASGLNVCINSWGNTDVSFVVSGEGASAGIGYGNGSVSVGYNYENGGYVSANYQSPNGSFSASGSFGSNGSFSCGVGYNNGNVYVGGNVSDNSVRFTLNIKF